MKKILLSSILLSSFCFASVPNPTKCPSVDSIRSIGLSENLVQDANGTWYAGRTSQYYDTSFKWSFVIGGIRAPDKQKAILEANEGLASLSFSGGPFQGPSLKWICLYQNDENLPSAAVNPPVTDIPLALR